MNNESVVIGYGVVGKAIAEAFGINKYHSRNENNILFENVVKCKYIHICLPTPTVNGECDISAITQFFKRVQEYPLALGQVYIIHSTVYAGCNKFLQEKFTIKNIVSCPEFLSEDTAVEDAKNPALIVIGADDPKYRELVKGIYTARFKYCEPLMTDSVTAELIKLSLNAFFTTKVVFANEIFDYAQKTGANYETIRTVLENHPWGSKNHFRVNDRGGRGAGGKCLSKDIFAFSGYTNSELLKTVNMININLLEGSGKK